MHYLLDHIHQSIYIIHIVHGRHHMLHHCINHATITPSCLLPLSPVFRALRESHYRSFEPPLRRLVCRILDCLDFKDQAHSTCPSDLLSTPSRFRVPVVQHCQRPLQSGRPWTSWSPLSPFPHSVPYPCYSSRTRAAFSTSFLSVTRLPNPLNPASPPHPPPVQPPTTASIMERTYRIFAGGSILGTNSSATYAIPMRPTMPPTMI